MQTADASMRDNPATRRKIRHSSAKHPAITRLDLPVDEPLNEWSANPKGYLQVKAQAMRPSRHPEYTVDSVTGPDHAPVVTVTVRVKGLGEATATAGSKSAAEVAAAATLLERLKA